MSTKSSRRSIGLLSVGIALLASPARGEVVLWNTLDSQAEVENSRIGLDGTFGGGTFVPGMSPAFGSAYRVDGSVVNPLVTFPKEALPVDAGTIEFWARLTNPPVSIPSIGGDNPAFVSLLDPLTNSNFRVALNANDGLGKGGLCGFAGKGRRSACTGGYGAYTYQQVLGTGQAQAWHHYALVWDRNGVAGVLGGTRKVVVFLDGVVDSGAFYEDSGADFVPLQGGALGVILSHHLSAATQIAVDNLIIRNVARTDFSDRFDPAPLVAVDVDIKPGSDTSPINPFAKGVIPVAILGSADFDVSDVDGSTLSFGPDGASLAHSHGPHFADVNSDGYTDLLAHFRTQETGIAVGDTEACLSGELLNGARIEGCDAFQTAPRCGLGFELALILPGLRWFRRRR